MFIKLVLAACLVACCFHSAYSQPQFVERSMPAFSAICYRGSGTPEGMSPAIMAGLYEESRNQGRDSFSPRLWLLHPLDAPYQMSSITGEWQLCQDLAAPPTRPVSQPYAPIERPAWRAGLLPCTATTDQARSACVASLLAEIGTRNYGLSGSPSLVLDGGSSWVIAPVAVPPATPAATPVPPNRPPQPGVTPR